MATITKPPYRVPLMAEIAKIPLNGRKVASTFSGAGGSCTGWRLAGFQVVYANEFVPIAGDSYAANHPTSYLDRRDIKLVQPGEILAFTGLQVGELDVLDGSPPCQAFSTAGKREAGWAKNGGKAKRYEHGTEQHNELLFFEYCRLLEGLQPKAFIAENVKGLTIGAAKDMMGSEQLSLLGGVPITGKDGEDLSLTADEDTILHRLMDAGYVVKWRVLDAKDHGVPQTRNRVIFFGVRRDLARRHGIEPRFPRPLGFAYTVRDALPWITEMRGADAGGIRARGAEMSPDAPCPTVVNGGDGRAARGKGQFQVVGTSCAPHSKKDLAQGIDEPSTAILARRPNVELAVLAEVPTGMFSKGLGRHRMRDGDKHPSPAITTTPTRVQVLPRDQADALLAHEAEVIGAAVEEAYGVKRRAPAVKITQQQGGAFDADCPVDQPIPCVCSSQPNQLVIEQVRRQLEENPGLATPKSGSGGFGQGGPTISGGAPCPAIMAQGVGGVGHGQYDVESVRLTAAGRVDAGTGASLELDASRLKVCDGTQEFGSAGAAAVPDQPSPPVLTPSNSVVCPTEKRKFTIPEVKRLCAFPDDYVLLGSYQKQWERLGNSVPPVMMMHIARSVAEALAPVPAGPCPVGEAS